MRSFQPMDYDPSELRGVTTEEITRRRQTAKLRSHPTATIQRAATKAAIHFRPLQYFCSQDEYTVFFSTHAMLQYHCRNTFLFGIFSTRGYVIFREPITRPLRGPK